MARDDTSRRRVVPEAANGSLWLAAAWTGVGAAAVCATAAIVAAAVCWLPVSGAGAHPLSALHAGLLTFLAGVHGGITVDGTSAAFVPLGLVLIVATTAWRAGSALGDSAAELGARDPRLLVRALLVQTAAFTGACLVAIPFAHLGTSSVPVLGVAAGAALLFGISAGSAFARASALADLLRARVPGIVMRGARGAAAALAVYLGVGALLVAASLVVHHAQVMALSRQVGGGWSGVPVLVLGLLAAPNAVIAAMTYLAGTGFAVGTGTHVAPGGATHGLVPAFPLLGALPAGAASPVVWVLVVATPLAAGMVAANSCRRAATWRARCAELGVSAGLAALASGVLAWQGGGSIGAGRLSAVGASAWLSALTIGAEVAVAGAVTLGLLAAVQWRTAARAERPALRPVVDVGLPDTPTDALRDAVPGGQVTERIEPAVAPALAVVPPAESDDADGAGKLAG